MATDVVLNEMANLRAFLEEAIVRADPTADVSPGSVYDTEVITPLIKRLGPDPYDTPIRDFLLGRLRAEFPDIVVQEGDPIDDYVIKILQVLVEPFRRQISLVSKNQSWQEPSTISDDDADDLGSNFFVPRRMGGFSSGVARLYFSTPQSVMVTPSNYLNSSGGLRFIPIENQAIDIETMRMNTEAGLYYFDIVVRAEKEGSEYNIGEDDGLVSIDGLTSVVKVVNQNNFEDGAPREDTESYVARVEASLAEKSLVTGRGIGARLYSVFENIRAVTVVGHNDPEMERDIVTATGGRVSKGVMSVSWNYGSNPNKFTIVGFMDDEGHENITDANLRVGDTIRLMQGTSSVTITDYTVSEIVSNTDIRTEEEVPAGSGSSFATWVSETPVIELSNIPGGILIPTTQYGTIQVVPNEVHIGGMLDVYVRAGFPQQRNTTLQAIRDGVPLRFGVDLESFGGEDTPVFVSLASRSLTAVGRVASAEATSVFVNVNTSSDLNWWPTKADVDRYVQLVSSGANGPHTYKIIDVLGRSLNGSNYEIEVVIDRGADYDKKSSEPYEPAGTGEPAAGSWTLRLKDTISIKNLVRDRDNSRPTIHAGVDFNALGTEIGDSVIIEMGPDADIYSVRKIVTSNGSNDTLVLSQDLTSTKKPSGSGDRSGLRYRLTNALDVDLVGPRTTKIPLGNIFEGGDLNTLAGSDTVWVAGITGTTDFSLAGVVVGDTLEILSGSSAGKYTVKSVTGLQLQVTPTPPGTSFAVDFSVYSAYTPIERPLVRVRDVQLLDSSLQSTGISVPYGDVVDVRVQGSLSNRAESVIHESYTGHTEVSPGYTFTDSESDFVALGIQPDQRLVILDNDNGGEYTIHTVSTHSFGLYTEAEGGLKFRSTSSNVHYRIGLPSTGTARFYFQEPTSFEVDTGLLGGRLEFRDGSSVKNYRFSSTGGRTVIPAPASDDDEPRSLRVLRYIDDDGYSTLLEFTDPDMSDVFDLELRAGDVVEVHEQIWWKDSSGDSLVFDGSGYSTIYTGFPAIHTTAGSDRVTVGPNSLVDFTQMNLVGQILCIESGPDEGKYTIEAVINSHTLQLSSAMKATTEEIQAYDLTAPGGDLSDVLGKANLHDANNPPGASPAAVGDFITIYEVTDPDNAGDSNLEEAGETGIAGTWEIESITDAYNIVLKDCPVTNLPAAAGSFRWYRTNTDENVEHKIHIYNAVPTKATVIDVGASESEKAAGSEAEIRNVGGDVNVLAGATGDFTGVEVGDRLEITFSPSNTNEGVRTVMEIDSVNASYVVVSDLDAFPSVEAGVSWRVRGGIYGNRKMVRVGPHADSNSDGKIEISVMPPFSIRRPDVVRVSSTEISESFDGALYYADVLIESMGAGDDLNLSSDSQLVITEGLRVDGYKYLVENNTLTFSPYEEVSLQFSRRFLPVGNSDLPENLTEISGRNLQINYDHSATAKVVDDLMHSDTERPINANPIVKHFLPSYVYTTVKYRGGSSSSLVGQEIEDYINNAGVTEIEVSDIMNLVTRRGAYSVTSPLLLVSVTHDLDRKLIVDRSYDKIGGEEETVPYNGTSRITTHFAKLREGLEVDRES